MPTFSQPLLKFIGDLDMVVPIVGGGSLLSHKDYVNYYAPRLIRIVDATGMMYSYREAKLTGNIHWGQSLRYFNVLYQIEPIWEGKPEQLSLDDFQEMVGRFVKQAPVNKGLDKVEKGDILYQIKMAGSFRGVHEVVRGVSYWR